MKKTANDGVGDLGGGEAFPCGVGYLRLTILKEQGQSFVVSFD